jgi:fructan beta-fructosidase
MDRASVETFVNRGEVSCAKFVLPKENGLSVKAQGGAVMIQSLTVWHLTSAWEAGFSD